MATATKSAAKSPAKKAPAKKPAAKKAPEPVVELTPIDDGVSVRLEGARAVLNIKGTFDLDGLIAVSKRVDRARAALS